MIPNNKPLSAHLRAHLVDPSNTERPLLVEVNQAGQVKNKTTYQAVHCRALGVAAVINDKTDPGSWCVIYSSNPFYQFIAAIGALYSQANPVLCSGAARPQKIQSIINRTTSPLCLVGPNNQLESSADTVDLSEVSKADKSNENIDQGEKVSNVILPTSGTTGRAQLAVYTGRDLYGVSTHILRCEFTYSNTPQFLNVFNGPTGVVYDLFNAIVHGGSVWWHHPFSPFVLSQTLYKKNIDWCHAPPHVYDTLADVLARNNTTITGTQFLSSGAYLPVSTRKRFENNTGSDCLIKQEYGTVETGIITINKEHNDDKPRSCGQTVTGTQYRIVEPGTNSTEAICDNNDGGEIIVKTKWGMSHYLNTDRESDSWYKTADYGYSDRGGFLFYTGRLTTQITVQGYTVNASALERTLLDKNEKLKRICIMNSQNLYDDEKLLVVLLPQTEGHDRIKKQVEGETGLPPDAIRIQRVQIPYTERGTVNRSVVRNRLQDRNTYDE